MASQDFAKAGKLDASAIPVIDIGPALDGTDLAGVAQQVFAAATEVGFFYISGHGIAEELSQQAFYVARDFFALPEADKQSVAVGTDQRGWLGPGMSRLENSKTHDLKEVFFWGTEFAADDPDLLAGKPLVALNRWPDEAFPRLKTELIPYYDKARAVGACVMSAIAVSLDLPEGHFAPHYHKPLARGQLVYYPPSTQADELEERFGVAPHTDFGVLTLLLQDQNGGLQVQMTSGEWVEAPPIPGTLVCNIGDLLQRWSNDRFVSTPHRVINRSGRERYSIPVFYDPHTDTEIDPCALGAPEQDRRHATVKAGAHIAGRNKKSFAQYKN